MRADLPSCLRTRPWAFLDEAAEREEKGFETNGGDRRQLLHLRLFLWAGAPTVKPSDQVCRLLHLEQLGERTFRPLLERTASDVAGDHGKACVQQERQLRERKE